MEPGVAPSHSEIFHTVLQVRRACGPCVCAAQFGRVGVESSTLRCNMLYCVATHRAALHRAALHRARSAAQFDMIGVELGDLVAVQSALIAATGEPHAPRHELDAALQFVAKTSLVDLLGAALPKARATNRPHRTRARTSAALFPTARQPPTAERAGGGGAGADVRRLAGPVGPQPPRRGDRRPRRRGQA
jgi:hypothetical protein